MSQARVLGGLIICHSFADAVIVVEEPNDLNRVDLHVPVSLEEAASGAGMSAGGVDKPVEGKSRWNGWVDGSSSPIIVSFPDSIDGLRDLIHVDKELDVQADEPTTREEELEATSTPLPVDSADSVNTQPPATDSPASSSPTRVLDERQPLHGENSEPAVVEQVHEPEPVEESTSGSDMGVADSAVEGVDEPAGGKFG